ncbi:MAG TPA: hypothetical protein VKF63_07355 [Terracidiphilus sp.]|nr:hypothetical protein [Terracidiphilus sp.]
MYVSKYTHIPHAKAKHFFHTLPTLEICTFGQTMVQNQKSVTNNGSKRLKNNTRPNDGSKAAKRWFKSQKRPAQNFMLAAAETGPLWRGQMGPQRRRWMAASGGMIGQ